MGDIASGQIASTDSEVFTIGHSTHDPTGFVTLLRRHRVACLIDVRSVPGSRRMPHFSKEALERSLSAEGVDYVHLSELGGRRRPVGGSPNGGWHSEGFRGYADFMASREFEAVLERLEELARKRPAAIMCAEALWWRCHRRLISDALTVRGWCVHHVGADGSAVSHELTPFAVVEGARITYPPQQASLDL